MTVLIYASLFMLLIHSAAQTDSFTRNFQIQVRSSMIDIASVFMPNRFQDLFPGLMNDQNDVTCASSNWGRNRRVDISLHQPTRIHAVSLLMHERVDVDLDIFVGNNSQNPVLCNRTKTNTGSQRAVILVCQTEIYGDTIHINDLRRTNEFFVICEVQIFGAPGTLVLPDNDSPGFNFLGLYIGVGVLAAVLIIAAVVIVLCKRRSNRRRASEAFSLNTLSMMNSGQAQPRNEVVRRNHRGNGRNPIPTPRPIVGRSMPNPYDGDPKETQTIYETIPGEEPPYLILVSEKELYDDASSYQK